MSKKHILVHTAFKKGKSLWSVRTGQSRGLELKLWICAWGWERVAGPEPWLQQWSEVSPGFPTPFSGSGSSFLCFKLLQTMNFVVLHSWEDKRFSFSTVSDSWACERSLIVSDKFNQCVLPSTCCIAASPVSAVLPLIFGADFLERAENSLFPIYFSSFCFPQPHKTLSDDVPAFSLAINNNVLWQEL